MVLPIIVLALIILAFAIVVLGMTDPWEIVALALVGGFVVQTVYK